MILDLFLFLSIVHSTIFFCTVCMKVHANTVDVFVIAFVFEKKGNPFFILVAIDL